MKTLFIFVIFFIQAVYADILEVVYEQRIPYVEKINSSVRGLVATPVINALNKSKIKYTLKEKPSKRHLYEIKANKKQICALGWFKNKDREKFAKFTRWVYQDHSLGIVSLKEKKSQFSGLDINELLKNKKYKVLTKASYSYGDFLDKKIKEYKVDTKEVYSDNENMLLLIKKKRADYMFISKEEASLFLKKDKLKDLVFNKLKGMPKGNKRYLICSKKVSDSTIDKINLNINE